MAFLGLDGFFAVAVGAGLDVVPAGSTAGWLGLAPPVVGAAGAGVGAEAAAVGADEVVVGAGAAAVVVACLGC